MQKKAIVQECEKYKAQLDVIQQIKHCLFRHIKTGLL